ncbi:MAG: BrxE family protein [Candidatus Thiodiazotropha endolucinida]
MAGEFYDTHAQRLQEIVRFRLIVGFLGEKGQHNWWSSEFFSATAPAFLNPVFGKTTLQSQYHGVKEAARRVHDQHIGIGRVFHLFRLPESIEQALFEVIQDASIAEILSSSVGSLEVALTALHEISESSGSIQEGPVQVGTQLDLTGIHWLSLTARCYMEAFNAGLKSYPYLIEQA